MVMYDWGRIAHKLHIHAFILSYIYLLRNDLIEINFEKLKNNFFSKMTKKKFIFYLLFFVFVPKNCNES